MGAVKTAAKKVTVNAVGNGKADEIELLEQIRQEIKAKAPDAYLNSLLTEEFVTWVAQQIRDDGAPDMYAFWMHDCQSNGVLRDRLFKMGEDFKRCTEDAQKAGEAASRVRGDVENSLRIAREMYQQAQCSANDQATERWRLQRELTDLKAARETDKVELQKLVAQLWANGVEGSAMIALQKRLAAMWVG